MAKFHVNGNTGSPGRCSASKGRCPFGGENEHFGTQEEAAQHFEKEMQGQVLQKYTKDLYMSTKLMNPPSDFVLDKIAQTMPMATHPKVRKEWNDTYEPLDKYEREFGDPRDVKIKLLDFSKHARTTHKMRRLRDGLDSVNNGRSNISRVLANKGRATKYEPSQSMREYQKRFGDNTQQKVNNSDQNKATLPGGKTTAQIREEKVAARQASLPPLAKRSLDISDEDKTYFQLEEDFDYAKTSVTDSIKDGKLYNTKLDGEGLKLVTDYDRLKRYQDHLTENGSKKFANEIDHQDAIMESKTYTDEKMRELGEHMTKLNRSKESISKRTLPKEPRAARDQIEFDLKNGNLPALGTLSKGDQIYGRNINSDNIKQIQDAQIAQEKMKRMMASGPLYSPEYEEQNKAEKLYNETKQIYKNSLDNLTKSLFKKQINI